MPLEVDPNTPKPKALSRPKPKPYQTRAHQDRSRYTPRPVNGTPRPTHARSTP